MTRWWTVGEVANFLEKFLDIVHNIAWCVRNETTVGNEENKIAQGMISMMRQPALKVQVSFLARFCKFWLNPHMKFYQRGDIFVKRPGFLCFHRTVGFFLMTQQINDIVKNGWQGHSDFKTTRAALDECEEEDRKILREMVDRFFQLVKKQVTNETRKMVSDAITDHRFSYWKQRSLDKKNNLFEKREIGQPKSTRESTDGWDVPPRLLGKIVFSELRKEHHLDAIKTELMKREALPATHDPTYTAYVKALKATESVEILMTSAQSINPSISVDVSRIY
jgi:hypothetical protein